MNLSMVTRGVMVVPAVWIACAPSHAQAGPISYVTQDRSINAFGYNVVGPDPGPVSKAVNASNFGPFGELVTAGQVAGEAQQASVLGNSSIIANGYGEGVHYIQVINSSGTSSFNVTFTINQTSTFLLAGNVIVSTCCSAKVEFTGPGVKHEIVGSLNNPNVEFYEVGVLEPGLYSLVAVGSGAGQSGFMPYGHGAYDFVLNVQVDCYPDCDQSGGLDIDDFVCFQTLYAIQDPKADCDQSGSLDIDDFVCFQTAYAVGC